MKKYEQKEMIQSSLGIPVAADEVKFMGPK